MDFCSILCIVKVFSRSDVHIYMYVYTYTYILYVGREISAINCIITCKPTAV